MRKIISPLTGFHSPLGSLAGSGGGSSASRSYTFVREALRVGTGTQTFTKLGFGTPKLAIITMTNATADGVARGAAVVSVGATDGTNKFALSSTSADANPTSVAKRRAATDVVLMESANGLVVEATGAFIEDGLELTVTANDDVQRLVTVELFGGADFSAYVGTFASQAVGAGISISGLGFEPDALMFATNLAGAAGGWNDVEENAGTAMFGLAANGASITQCGMGYQEVDGAGISATVGSVVSDGALQIPKNDSTLGSKIAVSAFNADGFDIDVSVATFPRPVGFIAINLNGGKARAALLDLPTAPGSKSWTGFGLRPGYLCMLPTMLSSPDVINNAGDGSAFGRSSVTAAEAFCNAWAIEDGADTTNTQSVSDDTALYLDSHDGSSAFRADLSSMDPDGFTLLFNAANGTGRIMPVLALE